MESPPAKNNNNNVLQVYIGLGEESVLIVTDGACRDKH